MSSSRFDLLVQSIFRNVLGNKGFSFEATPILFLPELIDHKISHAGKILSLFSLALLANFISQRKPFAFWYWYKTRF
jgi:hypothetical protein